MYQMILLVPDCVYILPYSIELQDCRQFLLNTILVMNNFTMEQYSQKRYMKVYGNLLIIYQDKVYRISLVRFFRVQGRLGSDVDMMQKVHIMITCCIILLIEVLLEGCINKIHQLDEADLQCYHHLSHCRHLINDIRESFLQWSWY